MKPILKVLICVVLLSASITAVAHYQYDPDDLKKFEETNSCQNCNLTNVSIYSENHQNSNLTGANISGSNLYGDYTKSKLTNINGINTSFSGITSASEVNFTNSKLINANFMGINLSDADFTDADVHGAKFISTNLYGAKMTSNQLATASSICNAILPDGSKGKCN